MQFDHQPWTLPPPPLLRLLLLLPTFMPHTRCHPQIAPGRISKWQQAPHPLRVAPAFPPGLGKSWSKTLSPSTRVCDTTQETFSVVHSARRLVFAGRKFESVQCTQDGARVPEFKTLTFKPGVGGGNSLYISSGPKARVLGSSSWMDLVTPASLRLQQGNGVSTLLHFVERVIS